MNLLKLENGKFRNLVRSLLSQTKCEYELTHASVDFCVQLLHLTNVKTFEKLSRKFKTSNSEWINQFIQKNGFFLLLQSIEKIFSQIDSQRAFSKSFLLIKCLKCIKNVMQANIAVEFFINLSDNEENCSIRVFSKICAISNQNIKKEVFELFAGIGMFSKEGYDVCLKFVESLKLCTLNSNRFFYIVNELKSNISIESVDYLIVLFGLINCLLSQAEHLKDSLKIRFELQFLNINEIIDQLKKLNNVDLIIQIDLYNNILKQDDEEFLFGNQQIDFFSNQKIENIKYHNVMNLISKININDNDAWNNLEMNIKEFISKKEKKFNDQSIQTDQNQKIPIKLEQSILKAPNYPPPLPPKTSLKDSSSLPPPPPPPLPNLFNNNTVSLPKTSLSNPKQIPTGHKLISDSTIPPPAPPLPPPLPPPAPPLPVFSLNPSQIKLSKKTEPSSLVTSTLPIKSEANKSSSAQPPQSPIPPPPPFSVILNKLPNPLPPPLKKKNSTNESSNLIMNIVPTPSKALKPLSWQKLPNTVLDGTKKTLWSEVNQKGSLIKIDPARLEELFSKSNINASKKPDQISKTNTADATQSDNLEMISFLADKNTMSIVVFLKKIKVPLVNYFNLIQEGKSSELGLDNLNCLKKILPEKSEVDEIRAYCKENSDTSLLSKADQFIKQLSDITNYTLRINLMTFQEEFEELYSRLEIQFKAYIKCSEQLLENESLKLFLGIILAFGNFINTNCYAGKAVGFKISILSKLNETKTNNYAINLLHLIIETFDEISKNDFINDLKDLSIILSHGYVNLSSDLNLLKKNLFEMIKQINNESTSIDIRNQYLNKFNAFKARVDILSNDWNKLEQLKQELIDYYCEDPLTFNFDEFFKIFADLCRNITKARDENKQRVLNEERKAKRAKDELEIKKSTGVVLRQPISEEKEENLSSLLSNLKKGQIQRNSNRISNGDEKLNFVKDLANVFSKK